MIISAPSGGGKTTSMERLLQIVPRSTRLVTSTSRSPRSHEQDGVHYHFLTKGEFEEKIKNNELIEYVEYVGNYYGVDRKELLKLLSEYDYVFAPIEVHGKRAIEQEDIPLISIFLLPENLEVLRRRLLKRGEQLSEDEIKRRLETARAELREAEHYDVKIVNKEGKFDETIDQILAAIGAGRGLDTN